MIPRHGLVKRRVGGLVNHPGCNVKVGEGTKGIVAREMRRDDLEHIGRELRCGLFRRKLRLDSADYGESHLPASPRAVSESRQYCLAASSIPRSEKPVS